MSGPKHTPGPWRIDVDEDAHVKVVKDSTGGLVAELFRRDFDEDPEHEANAKLIAAGPRLAAELAAWRAWAELWGRDIETSVSVSPITHNELVERLAATNAALREAGVE